MELDRAKEHSALVDAEIKKQMDDDGIKQAISQDTTTKESVAYITNLLKKRKWTGEETGRVLIYNLIKNLGRKPYGQEASKWKDIHPIYYKRLEKLLLLD
jgi:hypothetical protein